MANAVLFKASAIESVREALGLATAQRSARDSVGQRDVLPDEARGELAGPRGKIQPITLEQLDDQHACRHQCATALGDQLENRLQIGFAAQRPRDLDRRIQRLVGLL